MKYTLYIILDPKLNKGQRSAQAAHAGVEITNGLWNPDHVWASTDEDRERFNKWLDDPKVVITVASPEELGEVVEKAHAHGYYSARFDDDDFDVESWAVGPVAREHEKFFKHLRLA